MARASIRTLQDVVDHDLDLRVWCYCCSRQLRFNGRHMLAYFLYRQWPLDLATARRAFRCQVCILGGHILVLPASPPKRPARNWEDEVAGFFHASRRASKGRGASLTACNERDVERALEAFAAGERVRVEQPRPV